MDSKKYIAMDVHQATITVAVRDAAGKLVMESTIQTKAATIISQILPSELPSLSGPNIIINYQIPSLGWM